MNSGPGNLSHLQMRNLLLHGIALETDLCLKKEMESETCIHYKYNSY